MHYNAMQYNAVEEAEVNISSYPGTDVAGLFFFVVQKY